MAEMVKTAVIQNNDRYLYRAKRTDSGEWVEGYYLFCPIQADNKHSVENFIYKHWIVTHNGNPFKVDSSTICQCTGLKDKNGNLIWENDICRRILLPTKRIETNFRIAYVPYKCCLSAVDLDGSNITFLSDYINNQYEVEVVGNIFDNLELLEK